MITKALKFTAFKKRGDRPPSATAKLKTAKTKKYTAQLHSHVIDPQHNRTHNPSRTLKDPRLKITLQVWRRGSTSK